MALPRSFVSRSAEFVFAKMITTLVLAMSLFVFQYPLGFLKADITLEDTALFSCTESELGGEFTCRAGVVSASFGQDSADDVRQNEEVATDRPWTAFDMDQKPVSFDLVEGGEILKMDLRDRPREEVKLCFRDTCGVLVYNPTISFDFNYAINEVVDSVYVVTTLNPETGLSVQVHDDLDESLVSFLEGQGVNPNKPCVISGNGAIEDYIAANLHAVNGENAFDACKHIDAVGAAFVPDVGTDVYMSMGMTISNLRQLDRGQRLAVRFFGQEFIFDGNGSQSTGEFSTDEDLLTIGKDSFRFYLVDEKGEELPLKVPMEINFGKAVSVRVQDVVPPFVSFGRSIEVVDGHSVIFSETKKINNVNKAVVVIDGTVFDVLSTQEYGSRGLASMFFLKNGKVVSELKGERDSFVVEDVLSIGDTNYEVDYLLVAQDQNRNASLAEVLVIVDMQAPEITKMVYDDKVIARSTKPFTVGFEAIDSAENITVSAGVVEVGVVAKQKLSNDGRCKVQSVFSGDAECFGKGVEQKRRFSGHQEIVDGEFSFPLTTLNPGTYVLEMYAKDEAGNLYECESDICRGEFSIIEIGLEDVEISVDDETFNELPHKNAKTFYVGEKVLSYDVDLKAILKSEGLGATDVIYNLYRGDTWLSTATQEQVENEGSLANAFRARSTFNRDFPVFGFDLGSQYRIEILVMIGSTPYPVYESFFVVQKRGVSFVDENPVVVSADDIVVSQDANAGSSSDPRLVYLTPVESGNLTEGEQKNRIYRYVADGRDGYKMVVRLVDEYGNVMANYDLDAKTAGEDAEYFDVDVDQINGEFQESALRVESNGGSFAQAAWTNDGELFYADGKFYSSASVNYDSGYSFKLSTQSNAENVQLCSAGKQEIQLAGISRLNASVFVGGNLAAKQGRIEDVKANAAPYENLDHPKFIITPDAKLHIYCDSGSAGKMISLKF